MSNPNIPSFGPQTKEQFTEEADAARKKLAAKFGKGVLNGWTDQQAILYMDTVKRDVDMLAEFEGMADVQEVAPQAPAAAAPEAAPVAVEAEATPGEPTPRVPDVREVEDVQEAANATPVGRLRRMWNRALAPFNGAIMKANAGPVQRNGESDVEFQKRLNRRGTLLLGATGVLLAYTLSKGATHLGEWGVDEITQAGGGGSNIDLANSHTEAKPRTFEELYLEKQQEHKDSLANGIHYNMAEDPFFGGDKLRPHDFGAPLLGSDLDKPGQPAGFGELTQNRWKESPEQFATIMTGINLDPAFADNDEGINSLGEHLKNNPDYYKLQYDRAMGLMSAPDTKITEVWKDGNYGSLYEVDNNGDGVIAKDNNVNHGNQRVIVIEYTDANGNRQKLELNTECGGQRRWDVAQPVVQQVVETPQGSGPAPVTNYYEQPTTSYTPETPTGNGPPPKEVTPPPTTTPPTTTPPTTPPPVTPPVNPPVTPPVTPPGEQKGNAHPANEWVAPMGPGEFMPEPVPVETVVTTDPGRDIGGGQTQAPIIDIITNTPNTETGGQITEGTKPSLDIGGNAGGNTVQGPDTPATNNTEVQSGL